MNRARQILSPSFLVWLDAHSPEAYAFELCAGTPGLQRQGPQEDGGRARRALQGLGGGRPPARRGGRRADRRARPAAAGLSGGAAAGSSSWARLTQRAQAHRRDLHAVHPRGRHLRRATCGQLCAPGRTLVSIAVRANRRHRTVLAADLTRVLSRRTRRSWRCRGAAVLDIAADPPVQAQLAVTSDARAPGARQVRTVTMQSVNLAGRAADGARGRADRNPGSAASAGRPGRACRRPGPWPAWIRDVRAGERVVGDVGRAERRVDDVRPGQGAIDLE